MTDNADDRLIIALDVDSFDDAVRMAKLLAPVTRFFKIGSYLFTLEGPRLVEKLVADGFRVFLDLKFHDIPEVVAGAVRNAVRLGASMATVHASGGEEMMKAAAAAVAEFAHEQRPLLLGATVLTSFSTAHWRQVFPHDSITDAVVRLARLAESAGLGGLVCSPQELAQLGRVTLKKVVPGIRPSGNVGDDQQRVMTPARAVAAGADYLVVGRPIIRAADPLQAASQIRRQMETGD